MSFTQFLYLKEVSFKERFRLRLYLFLRLLPFKLINVFSSWIDLDNSQYQYHKIRLKNNVLACSNFSDLQCVRRTSDSPYILWASLLAPSSWPPPWRQVGCYLPLITSCTGAARLIMSPAWWWAIFSWLSFNSLGIPFMVQAARRLVSFYYYCLVNFFITVSLTSLKSLQAI